MAEVHGCLISLTKIEIKFSKFQNKFEKDGNDLFNTRYIYTRCGNQQVHIFCVLHSIDILLRRHMA